MHHEPAGDRAAVSGALFAQICRANPVEARDLSKLLTASERVALALICNARSHLREHGRAIAGACSRESLLLEGGQAGLALFNQIDAGEDTWGAVPRAPKRPVSLARS